MAKVPFRPMYGTSTAQVAARAAGTPTTARIKVLNVAVKHSVTKKREITHITVCDIQRGVSEMSSTTGQPVSRHMRPFSYKGENQEYHLKEW